MAGTVYVDGNIFLDMNLSDIKQSSQKAYIEARSANLKIDLLQSAVTAIQSNLVVDTTPPVVKISSFSGASATSGNAINVVLEISDNAGSSTFLYSTDGIAYSPVPADDVISLPINNLGINVKQVWVKDEAGNVGKGIIKIRKI